ncbi:MAG: hypothetical protein LIP02_00855 [Bacteroidales bacterium]|nr:hypothetical protein [Bacteroidales bacterium]
MIAQIHYLKLILIFFCLFILTLSSCGGRSIRSQLDYAEELMEDHPDSALAILQAVDESSLKSKEIMARYSLLHAMALDKNWIDTADINIIQPAVDWYCDHGKADDRLKAMYYAGRIVGNGGDKDSEMSYYVKASQWIDEASDTSAICRLLIAQGVLYQLVYDFQKVLEMNVRAAELSEKSMNWNYALACHRTNLGAACVLKDSIAALSALDKIITLGKSYGLSQPDLYDAQLQYTITFSDYNAVRNLMRHAVTEKDPILDGEAIENICRGLLQLKEFQEAYNLISAISPCDLEEFTRLKYWILRSQAAEGLGYWEEALKTFQNYSALNDTIETRALSQQLQFSKERHDLELAHLQTQNSHDSLFYRALVVVLFLLALTVLALWRNKINSSLKNEAEQRRLIAETQQKLLESENLNLKQEAEKFQLEQERNELLLAQLERERDDLKIILAQNTQLNNALIAPLLKRSQLLDRFMLSQITDNPQIGKDFHKWVSDLTKNREDLLTDMRNSFKAAYPIAYGRFIAQELTETELNYVCLYAAGLRGSEVGNVMGTKRHYIVSHEIRRKLGLDSTSQNLGPFIKNVLEGTK